jgi:hypothetical protein
MKGGTLRTSLEDTEMALTLYEVVQGVVIRSVEMKELFENTG